MSRNKPNIITNFDLDTIKKDIKKSKDPDKTIKMMLNWLDKHDMLSQIGKNYFLKLIKLDYNKI